MREASKLDGAERLDISRQETDTTRESSLTAGALIGRLFNNTTSAITIVLLAICVVLSHSLRVSLPRGMSMRFWRSQPSWRRGGRGNVHHYRGRHRSVGRSSDRARRHAWCAPRPARLWRRARDCPYAPGRDGGWSGQWTLGCRFEAYALHRHARDYGHGAGPDAPGQSVYNLPAALTIFGGGRIFGGLPISVIVTIIVFVLGEILLKRTAFGKSVYAVGGNREAARLVGIDVNAVTFVVYLLAGVCAGIAAILTVGRVGAATPTGGAGVELRVIAAIVIGGATLFGGKGSLWGTLVGVLLIGVINNGWYGTMPPLSRAT